MAIRSCVNGEGLCRNVVLAVLACPEISKNRNWWRYSGRMPLELCCYISGAFLIISLNSLNNRQVNGVDNPLFCDARISDSEATSPVEKIE